MLYVEINGVSTETSRLVISNRVTRTPDEAIFTVNNPTSVPAVGQSVLIYRDSTDNKLFAGTITMIEQSKLTPNEVVANRTYSYRLYASDYQRQLDRYLVNQTYANKTCKQIIDDFVSNFTDPAIGFTTNNVSTGPTVTSVTYSYKRIAESIGELADLVGYDWYVDVDKDIHFFQKKTLPAPYEITDDVLAGIDDDSRRISYFELIPNYNQVRNRVYVRGGFYLSSAYTESFAADGTQRTFPLAWKPHNVSALTVGGAPKTYAVDYINPDDGTYEYYWNYQEKYIRCGDFTPEPTPGAGVVIAVTYQYEVPILIRVDDPVSQAAIATIEGGTGIYENIIKDETIDTKTWAQDVGLAELERFANPLIKGTFITYDHGFRAGQSVTINLSDYSAYNGEYIIQSVNIKPVTPDDLQYDIVFATTLYELKDLLIDLLRGDKIIKIREDEMVDILKIVNETVTITDSVTTTLTSHPSKWGVPTMWGLATYGS